MELKKRERLLVNCCSEWASSSNLLFLNARDPGTQEFLKELKCVPKVSAMRSGHDDILITATVAKTVTRRKLRKRFEEVLGRSVVLEFIILRIKI
jgi:hypothetical protein